MIFANGELSNKEKARALLDDDDFIIAADGGTRHIFALGRMPNVVIGDLDSVTKEEIEKIKQSNIDIILFPRDKNETDLELAIQHALTLKPEQIIIIGALGGRLDQTIGNIALTSNVQPSTFNIRLDDGVEEISFCHNESNIYGTIGDTVSLIPWQGEVTGVLTTGLKWPLQSETLYPQKTRGISNEMTNETATVQIKSGLLLIIHRRLNNLSGD
jgi:thiamine pyrophosphokinase